MQKSWLKYVFGLAVSVVVLILPARAALPNVEPVMGFLMPFSKRYGHLAAFLFGALAMLLQDLFMDSLDKTTPITAAVYGLVGLLSYLYFKKRAGTTVNFVKFSIIGTLSFDGLTMLIGPIMGHQVLMEAIAGQVPFTLQHLLSSITLALVVSPLVYAWVAEGEETEVSMLWKKLKLLQN